VASSETASLVVGKAGSDANFGVLLRWRSDKAEKDGEGDDGRRQQHPHRREREGGSHDGPELHDVGPEAAVEEDEGERHGADPVGELVVLEDDPAESLLPGQHADEEEQHEDRQPHAGGKLARCDAEDEEHRGEQDHPVDAEHGMNL